MNCPNCNDEEWHESHVDALIDLITQFSESADKLIYQSVFNTVINQLKQIESPDSIDTVTNAWEFLGVINYHGGDHGLWEVTVSDLKETVGRVISSLPLHERFLLILAYGYGRFDWQDNFKNEEADIELLIEYLTTDEPFHETVESIAETILLKAPDYSPY